MCNDFLSKQAKFKKQKLLSVNDSYTHYELFLTLMRTKFQFCWQNGGYLAEITSETQDYESDVALDMDSCYWIGLTDIRREGG